MFTMSSMNIQQLESDIVMARLILQTIGAAKQLCKGSSSYMNNYLQEISDRTATQISLMQEILNRADEFPQPQQPPKAG